MSRDLTPASALLAGAVLRRKWTLIRLLGIGGMGAVYEAKHRNGRRSAVKVLHPHLATHPKARQRFLRESLVANRIAHPGVVEIYDDDVSDDGFAFLVMELLDGLTVKALADQSGGVLGIQEVAGLADAILDILAAAHEQGIIHRDVKPQNVFVTTKNQVRLLDFGIAAAHDSLFDGEASTHTGQILGSPAFMAPEQARGRWNDVDCQSDIWAVGACMFTLFSGRFVHIAATPNEQLILTATQPASPLVSRVPSIPDPLAQVVDRALVLHKGGRWHSARQMQEALREVMASLKTTQAVAPSMFQRNLSFEPTRAETDAVSSASGMSVSGSAWGASRPHDSLHKPKAISSRSWRWNVVGAALVSMAGMVGVVSFGSYAYRRHGPNSAPTPLDAAPAEQSFVCGVAEGGALDACSSDSQLRVPLPALSLAPDDQATASSSGQFPSRRPDSAPGPQRFSGETPILKDSHSQLARRPKAVSSAQSPQDGSSNLTPSPGASGRPPVWDGLDSTIVYDRHK